jgi:hypothetical protein
VIAVHRGRLACGNNFTNLQLHYADYCYHYYYNYTNLQVWKQRRLKVAGAAAAAAAAAAREGEGGVLAASAAIAAAVAELDATPVSAQVRRQQLGLGASNGTNGSGASPAGGATPVRVTPCDLLAVVERSSSCISDSGSSCWCNLCALTAMTCSAIQRIRLGVYKGVQRSTPV